MTPAFIFYFWSWGHRRLEAQMHSYYKHCDLYCLHWKKIEKVRDLNDWIKALGSTALFLQRMLLRLQRFTALTRNPGTQADRSIPTLRPLRTTQKETLFWNFPPLKYPITLRSTLWGPHWILHTNPNPFPKTLSPKPSILNPKPLNQPFLQASSAFVAQVESLSGETFGGLTLPSSSWSPFSTSHTLRVQVHNKLINGTWVIVNIVQGLGKYMIMRYLTPLGI